MVKNTYFCPKCKRFHFYSSNIGKQHRAILLYHSKGISKTESEIKYRETQIKKEKIKRMRENLLKKQYSKNQYKKDFSKKNK